MAGEKRKLCPLLCLAKMIAIYLGGAYPVSEECLEEECAWWDKRAKRCAIRSQ